MQKDKIDELWNRTADRLLSLMEDPDPSPAMVREAIRFLKDNEVEALPVAGGGLDHLKDNLPFPKVGMG